MYILNAQLLKLSLVLLFGCENLYCYNIIHIFPFAPRSHKNVFDPLITELAKRGHNVTIVTSYKNSHPEKNINEIFIEHSSSFENSKFQQDLFSSVNRHPLATMSLFKKIFLPMCTGYLQHPKIKQLLNEGKQYDIVILNAFLNECTLATAPLLGKNIITQSPASLCTWCSTASVPQPPSYVPSLIFPYTSNMNFLQRLNNAVTIQGLQLLYKYQVLSSLQTEVAKHLPDNPSITEASKLVSLFLTNCDPVLISPRQQMPYVVNVGGMHCQKAKPLPKDLEDFVQSSGESGFIYFSLGSNAQSRYLPDNVKKSLLDTFSKVKQKVVWKYEEELVNGPSNVKIVKWAPQQDLLGHSKIQLFITHGGLLSMQESVYHAVPVVAVPLFGDQGSNVARVQELEIGVKVDFHNISGSCMLDAVNTFLLYLQIQKNMLKYSALFRDRPVEPVEEAASWVEYTVKHNGAWHLKSSADDLNFFQYFLLDIMTFILIIFISAVCLLAKFARFLAKL
uniref:UDP-glucuronosyltransferase n=1 Tax=Strigamia maritima TaxID=126957 RepID=A0A023R9J0_STRMM|nr:UDP-glycosyltransferase 211G1 [Strigamia maritima]